MRRTRGPSRGLGRNIMNASRWVGLAVAVCFLLGFSKPANACTLQWKQNATFDFQSGDVCGGDACGGILAPPDFPRSGNNYQVTITTSLSDYLVPIDLGYAEYYEFYIIGKPSYEPSGFPAYGEGSPFFGYGNVASSYSANSQTWDYLSDSNTGQSVLQTYMPLAGSYTSGGNTYQALAPWLLTSYPTPVGSLPGQQLLYPYDTLGSNVTWYGLGGVAGVQNLNQVCNTGGGGDAFTSPVPSSFALDDLTNSGACQTGDTTNCTVYVSSTASMYNDDFNESAYCMPSSGAPQGPCLYYWNNFDSISWSYQLGWDYPTPGCANPPDETIVPALEWSNVPGNTAAGDGSFCYGSNGLTTSSSCAGAVQITYDVIPSTHVLYALDVSGDVWSTPDTTSGAQVASGTWTPLPTVGCTDSCSTGSCSTTTSLTFGQIAAYDGIVFAITAGSNDTTPGYVWEYNEHGANSYYPTCNDWIELPTTHEFISISSNPFGWSNLTAGSGSNDCAYTECALIGSGSAIGLQQMVCN
jgi:hypothetical protein